MGKILNHGNRWKKEKGLTLIETIIALGIIVIVTVASVSIAVYCANTFNDLSVKRFFQREIDNIAEIYLSYYDEDDSSNFSSAFNRLTGKTITGYVDTTYYLNENLEYVESTDEHSYTIVLDFEGTRFLNIDAMRLSGERTIRSRSVER